MGRRADVGVSSGAGRTRVRPMIERAALGRHVVGGSLGPFGRALARGLVGVVGPLPLVGRAAGAVGGAVVIVSVVMSPVTVRRVRSLVPGWLPVGRWPRWRRRRRRPRGPAVLARPPPAVVQVSFGRGSNGRQRSRSTVAVRLCGRRRRRVDGRHGRRGP